MRSRLCLESRVMNLSRRPLVDAWRMSDNSSRQGYTLIACETSEDALHIEQEAVWNSIMEAYA